VSSQRSAHAVQRHGTDYSIAYIQQPPLTLPHSMPLTSSPLPTGERQGEGGEDKGEGVNGAKV